MWTRPFLFHLTISVHFHSCNLYYSCYCTNVFTCLFTNLEVPWFGVIRLKNTSKSRHAVVVVFDYNLKDVFSKHPAAYIIKIGPWSWNFRLKNHGGTPTTSSLQFNMAAPCSESCTLHHLLPTLSGFVSLNSSRQQFYAALTCNTRCNMSVLFYACSC